MGAATRKIELLAPARNFPTAKAAIDCGADAVYIGGSSFGARKDAANSTEDIRRTVEYARRYGVRVYATLNTVLFDDELEEARRLACSLVDAGVDALIVQDAAYLRMGLSGVELHSSTQMFNASPRQAAFLSKCGFSRIILERNLSIDEIRAVRRGCDADLECFVHGAVCVCYSGRCAMSLSLGAGSGNRGTCSQPCRLTYDLVNGAGETLVRGKHLLSVRDLDLSGRIGELIDAGVSSFKIEGRLKDMNYVRNVTAFYRRAVDKALKERAGYERSSWGETELDFEPDLAKSFTRSGSTYFFDGARRGVASFDTPKSVGERAGTVSRVSRGGFILDRPFGFAAGDGICFMKGGVLCGTNINSVEGELVRPNRMDGIERGTVIYRNYDHAFNQLLDRDRTVRRVGVKIQVTLSAGTMRMSVCDARGNGVSGEVALGGETARNAARVVEGVKEAAAKSGGTMFRVDGVEVTCGEAVPFVSAAEVNGLRRGLLDELQERLGKIPCAREMRREDMSARSPQTVMDMSENVNNRLAEEFYRSHGVEQVERGVDSCSSFEGVRVMCTRYCLRRETGHCLRRKDDGEAWRGALYLVRGNVRYALGFDCDKCEMSVIKER